MSNNKKKKKRSIARSNKPGSMTPAQGQAQATAAAQRQVNTANQIINLVLQALAPRLNKLETSIANKIESDAVSFRLLFDYAGIDSGMRQSALRELHIVRELLSLTSIISSHFNLDTAEGIFMELTNIPLRVDEHKIEHPITVVVVWAKPGTEFDNNDLPAVTLCALPGEGVKFDTGAVTPDREEGELAFVFIDKDSFVLASKGQSSAELEYMEHMVGIDMPAVVGNFIFALDLDGYFAGLKKEAAERNRHPEGAKRFGGNP